MSKDVKHLSYFKIENFKRFQTFEMKDIGQFNLIVGDNNVGKTSILESLLLNENINSYLHHLFSVLVWKGFDYEAISGSNFMEFFVNKFYDDKPIEYHYRYQNTLEHSLKLKLSLTGTLDKDELTSFVNNTLPTLKNDPQSIIVSNNNKKETYSISYSLNKGTFDKYVPLITSAENYKTDIVGFYIESIQKSKKIKEEFISTIQFIIPEIVDFELSAIGNTSETVLAVRLASIDQLIPLNLYGEGVNRLIRILLEIIQCKGQRLMIDDVDFGIYFKKFSKFWQIIFKTAKENNVQLFCTTHSYECIKYFTLSLKNDNEYKDFSRVFAIQELPNKEVKAYNYKFDEFNYAIEMGHEIRGI